MSFANSQSLQIHGGLDDRSEPLPTPPLSEQRVPALDAIRGLAVLMVLYCHSTMVEDIGGTFGRVYLATARLGWAGVDLFFVLSGFLITGILFDAKGTNGFFRNFYARRTVRIFPLYYVFLVVALVILPKFAALNAHFGEMPKWEWPYWLYVSNFYQIFDPTHHIVFVSWSLAIEEQFYLAWPLVVFLFGRRTLVRIAIGMILGSIVLRCGVMLPLGSWLESHGLNPWRIANNFTLCRLDGLAAGAWIALMIRGGASNMKSLAKPAAIIGPVMAVLLMAIVGGAYFSGWRGGIGQGTGYVLVGYTVLALMFGSFLVLCVNADPKSILGRISASKTLIVFGKYSYAVYLFHYPVNLVVRDFMFNPESGTTSARKLALQAAFYIVSAAVTLGLSWLSWHLMEKHFLKLKALFPMASGRSRAPDQRPTEKRTQEPSVVPEPVAVPTR